MPRSEPTQLRILDEVPPQGQNANVTLDIIDGESLYPEAQFIENVRSLGVIQPIALAWKADGSHRFDLISGRRRLTALKEITPPEQWGNTSIPALIFPAGTSRSVLAAMSLSENVQRRPNPLTDLESIETLRAMDGGMPLEEMARQLHIPVGTIRARMRLGNLIPELRAKLRDGLMASSTAERACRLDSGRQRELLARAGDGVRITSDNVTDVLRAGQEAQVEALPDAIFGDSNNRYRLAAIGSWDTASPAQETSRASRGIRDALDAGAISLVRAPTETREEFLIRQREAQMQAEFLRDHPIRAVMRETPPLQVEWMADGSVRIREPLIDRTTLVAAPAARQIPPQIVTVDLPPLDAQGLPESFSWNGVYRCIQRAIEVMPIQTTEQDERIAEWLTDLEVMLKPRAR